MYCWRCWPDISSAPQSCNQLFCICRGAAEYSGETFEIGIRKTVQWYLDHPDWVANVLSGGYRDWVAQQSGN